MALKIEFEPAGPEAGTLIVRGLDAEVGREVLAAVERTDDGRWLTLHGGWSAEATWFPCPRVQAPAAEDRFSVAAPLAAGLRAAARLDLRAHLRRLDFADAAPLRVRQGAPAGDSGLRPAPDLAAPVPAPPHLPEPATAAPTPKPVPRRAAPLRALAASALVLSAAALLWSLLPSGSHPGDRPEHAAPPGPPTAQPGGLSGRERAAALKARGLAPADLFREAEQAEQAHDCDAALRLFVDAAKAEATLADRLASRYDPADFTPSPCFAEPQADSAQRWYRQAAEQGIHRAQRRLGELLLAEGSAGPLYLDALDWLRRAAAAGDGTAARRLAELGER